MSKNITVFPPLNSPLYGIGLMIIMTACFSLLDASAKYLCNELSLWMVMWGRYFFHFIFFTVFFLRGAPRDIIVTKNLTLQILRSVLIFGAGVTFWSGLMYLPLADCTVIASISPILVTILAVFLLGEKFGYHRLGSVIIGLLGDIGHTTRNGNCSLGDDIPTIICLFLRYRSYNNSCSRTKR